jgi:hypothetical protein
LSTNCPATTEGRSQARFFHCCAVCVKSPSMSYVHVATWPSLMAFLNVESNLFGSAVKKFSAILSSYCPNLPPAQIDRPAALDPSSHSSGFTR